LAAFTSDDFEAVALVAAFVSDVPALLADVFAADADDAAAVTLLAASVSDVFAADADDAATVALLAAFVSDVFAADADDAAAVALLAAFVSDVFAADADDAAESLYVTQSMIGLIGVVISPPPVICNIKYPSLFTVAVDIVSLPRDLIHSAWLPANPLLTATSYALNPLIGPVTSTYSLPV
jgi:hypothetical protein